MERNDTVFLSGMCLTALLVAIPAALLRGELSGLELFLYAGWACGFAFSWFFWRIRDSRLHHVLSAFGVLAVMVWMAVAVANSSFGYKEVVLICLKGVLLLTVVLSFFVPEVQYLTAIQYLSLPVFLGQALYSSYASVAGGFISGTVLYLAVWAALIRLKLVFMTDGRGRQQFAGPASIILLAVFFTSSFGSAHYLVKHFSGPKVRYEGILLEEKRDDSGSSEEEYYGKLESLQKEIVKYIPELKSKEDRQKVLMYLTTLTKEAANSLATSKAEEGIHAAFNDPRGGLKKEDARRGLSKQLKDFVQTKTVYAQAKGKAEFLSEVKKDTFNLKERFKLINGLHAMASVRERSKIGEKERRLNSELEKMSDNSSQKARLNQSVGRIAEWKMFDLYKEKLQKIEKSMKSGEKGEKGKSNGELSLPADGMEKRSDQDHGAAKGLGGEYSPGKKRPLAGKAAKRGQDDDSGAESLSGTESQEMRKLLNKIKAAGELPEMKDADGVLKRLQRSITERAAGLEELKNLEGEIKKLAREQKEQASELEELLKLKVEMLVRQLASDLKGEIAENAEISSFLKARLIKDTQGLSDANGARQVEQSALALENHCAGEEKVAWDAQELTAAKIFQQELDTVERLNGALDHAAQGHEKARDFLRQLDQSLARSDQAQREAELGELEAGAESFKKDGLISSSEHAVVREGLQELRELSRLDHARGNGKGRDKRKDAPGASADLERLLDDAGFESSVRNALENFLKGAQQAQTVSQLEEVQVAWNRQAHELQAMTQHTKDFEQFKQQFEELLQARRTLLMERQMASLREKLEQLERIDSESAEELERKLDMITKGANMQEMRQEIEKLKDDVERTLSAVKDRKEEKSSANEKLLKDESGDLDQIREQLTQVNAKIRGLEQQLMQSDQDRERIIEQLNEAVKLKQALEKQMKELNDRKDEYEKALPQELREQREQLQKKDAERRSEIELQRKSAEQELRQAEAELTEIAQQEKQLSRQLQQKDSTENAAEIQEQLREIAERKKELTEQIEELNDRTTEIEKQPAEKDVVSKMERSLRRVSEQELQQADEEISDLAQREKQFSRQLQQKDSAENTEEMQKRLREIDERKEQAAERKQELKKQIEELNDSKVEIEKQPAEKDVVSTIGQSLRHTAEQELRREEKELSELAQQEKQLSRQLQQKDFAENSEETQKQLREIAERKEQAAERKQGLEKQIEELNDRKAEIEQQQSRKDASNETEQSLMQNAEQRMQIAQKMQTVEKEKQQLEKELTELDLKKQQIEQQMRQQYSDKASLERQLDQTSERREEVLQKLENLDNRDNLDDLETPGGNGGGKGIYVLPFRLVASAGTAVQLTAVAVVENLYVKDITRDAEWVSDNPAIARVDSGGRVLCVSPGVTRVAVTFKDGGRKTIDVAVGDSETAYMKGIRGMIK